MPYLSGARVSSMRSGSVGLPVAELVGAPFDELRERGWAGERGRYAASAGRTARTARRHSEAGSRTARTLAHQSWADLSRLTVAATSSADTALPRPGRA